MEKGCCKIDTNPQPETYLDSSGKQVATGRKYKTSIEDFGVTQ